LSTDPEQIIRSPETKVLTVRFERNVSADDARKAWRDGLENNCMAPCHLALEDVEKFLADIPAMHTGDSYSLVFTQHGATVTVSGHLIGTVSQRQFAEAMLATFLGLRPASPRLKRELLRHSEPYPAEAGSEKPVACHAVLLETFPRTLSWRHLALVGEVARQWVGAGR
jgi:hypothetical protein